MGLKQNRRYVDALLGTPLPLPLGNTGMTLTNVQFTSFKDVTYCGLSFLTTLSPSLDGSIPAL